MAQRSFMSAGNSEHPDPAECPLANEVVLTLGIDDLVHKVRLMVDGRQKWVRIGFKEVESMFSAQEFLAKNYLRSDITCP